MEPPPAFEPRSPDLPPDVGMTDRDDPVEVDLEPRPPVTTPDPLASRLIPGELAILSVVAAIVLVAGWIALEFVGMVAAPPSAPPIASPIASPASTLVAGLPSPGASTPGPSGTASSAPPSASPPATPIPSYAAIALVSGDPVAGRWRRIASPAIGGRTDTAVAWSGEEVLVWGGFNGEARWGDGGAYNPVTNRWRRLPKSPLTARMAPAAAWTGSEFLVWGGYQVRFAVDGAAYDPEANRWRELPAAPLAAAAPNGAWTGTRFLVVTGMPQAAAYDPAANTWEALPPPPLEEGAIQVVVIGERGFVLRKAVDPGQPISIAELNAADGTWRRLDDGPATADGAARPALVAGPLLVVGDAVFDSQPGSWSVIDRRECQFSADLAVATGPLVLSPAAAVDLAERACPAMPPIPNPPPGGPPVAPVSVWTGRDWIVWSGGSGEPGVLFEKDGVAFRPTGD